MMKFRFGAWPIVGSGAALSILFAASSGHAQTRNVVCVGDSITAGYGATSGLTSYVTVLGNMFGQSGKVSGFGHSGSTALTTSTNPFTPFNTTAEYASATSFVDGIDAGSVDVLIMLGTNDSAPQNWNGSGGSNATTFVSSYTALVDHFAGLSSHPKIWAVLPPAIYNTVTVPASNDDCTLHYQIIPIIREIASQKSIPTIDVYAATSGHPEYFLVNGVYGVHPNDMGHQAIANAMYDALTGEGGVDAGAETGGVCDGGVPVPPPILDSGAGDAASGSPDAGADASSGTDSGSSTGPTADTSKKSGGCEIVPGTALAGGAWLLGVGITGLVLRRRRAKRAA
jgi:lysophospholipase L1-like esterase